MKKTYFILLLLELIGCSEKKTDLSFNFIDYSYYNGWSTVYSLKIDNLGQAYMQMDDINDSRWFAKIEITPSVLDSLSILVNMIDYVNLDTLYKRNCTDCGYYYLIINKQESIPIKIFVEDTNNNDKKLIKVNELSEYINSFGRAIGLQLKSIQFESKTRDFYLIPTSQLPPPFGAGSGLRRGKNKAPASQN